MAGESKASRLADELLAHIDTYGLVAGTPLGTKSAIAEQHRVSPGTLNEALRLLQVRDYVFVRPGPKGGVFVGQKRQRAGLAGVLLTGQDKPQDVNDYLKIQDALQELVTTEAAFGCDAQSAIPIRRALERLATAVTPREIFEINWEVDRAIARAGDNQFLSEMYCALIDSIEASIRWFAVEPEMAEGARITHAAMANAVIANDVEAAVEAARQHSPADGSGPAWRISDRSP